MAVDFNITAELLVQGPPAGNLNSVYQQLQSSMKPLSVGVSVNGANAVSGDMKRIEDNLRGVNAGLALTSSGFGQMASASGRAASGLRDIQHVAVSSTGFLENLSSAAGLAAKRFLAFTVAAGAMVKLSSSIKDNVSEAISFERQMNKIAQISSETAVEIKGVEREVSRLSTSLGTSSRDLIGVAEQLKQTGLSVSQVTAALEPLAKASLAPSFGNIVQTTQGAIAVMRQFDIDVSKLGDTLGSVNAVAAGFAVESEDIIEATKRAGGAFKVAGGNLNEFLALFTSVRATTRESAESISTGLRTIFARFQRSSTVDLLKDLGVNLRYTTEEANRLGNVNLTNQFVGAYEAVARLNQALSSIPTTDTRYAAIVESLGGLRQVSKVIPLIQQFNEAQRVLAVAQTGSISLTMAADKAQESLAVRFQSTKEKWLELGRAFVQSNTFQTLADSGLQFANVLAKILDFAKPLLPVLAGLAVAKLGTSFSGIVRNFSNVFSSNIGARIDPNQGTGSINRYVPKLARGGVIPGEGNTDSYRADLMPGEFVVRKQAARAIGYDRLHDLNEGRAKFANGGRVRFENGNLVPRLRVLPRTQRASYEELIESIRSNANENNTDGRNSEYPASLLTAATGYGGKFAESVTSLIPKGTRFIGSGLIGLGFQTPNNEVVRLQSQAAGQFAFQHFGMKFFSHRSLLKSSRINHPRVAQPFDRTSIKNRKFGQRTVLELLPYIQDVESVDHEQLADLHRSLADSGLVLQDGHRANLGILNGKLIVRDPGSVRPMRRHEEPMYAKTSIPSSASTFQTVTNDEGFRESYQLAKTDGMDAIRTMFPVKWPTGAAGTIRNRGKHTGPVRMFAKGDFVPGIGDKDSVPSLLMPGEFVIRREAAQAIGTPGLRRLNNADKIQKFAGGGLVGFNKGGEVETITYDQAKQNPKLAASIEDAAKKAGVSLYAFTEVLVKTTGKLKEFVDFAKPKAERFDLRKDALLSPKERDALLARNIDPIQSTLRNSAYGKVVGVDPAALSIQRAAELLDVSKIKRHDKKEGPYSPEEVYQGIYGVKQGGGEADPGIVKAFDQMVRGRAIQGGNKALQREFEKTLKGGAVGDSPAATVAAYKYALESQQEGVPSPEKLKLETKEGRFFDAETGKKLRSEVVARRLANAGFKPGGVKFESATDTEGEQRNFSAENIDANTPMGQRLEKQSRDKGIFSPLAETQKKREGTHRLIEVGGKTVRINTPGEIVTSQLEEDAFAGLSDKLKSQKKVDKVAVGLKESLLTAQASQSGDAVVKPGSMKAFLAARKGKDVPVEPTQSIKTPKPPASSIDISQAEEEERRRNFHGPGDIRSDKDAGYYQNQVGGALTAARYGEISPLLNRRFGGKDSNNVRPRDAFEEFRRREAKRQFKRSGNPLSETDQTDIIDQRISGGERTPAYIASLKARAQARAETRAREDQFGRPELQGLAQEASSTRDKNELLAKQDGLIATGSKEQERAARQAARDSQEQEKQRRRAIKRQYKQGDELKPSDEFNYVINGGERTPEYVADLRERADKRRLVRNQDLDIQDALTRRNNPVRLSSAQRRRQALGNLPFAQPLPDDASADPLSTNPSLDESITSGLTTRERLEARRAEERRRTEEGNDRLVNRYGVAVTDREYRKERRRLNKQDGKAADYYQEQSERFDRQMGSARKIARDYDKVDRFGFNGDDRIAVRNARDTVDAELPDYQTGHKILGGRLHSKNTYDLSYDLEAQNRPGGRNSVKADENLYALKERLLKGVRDGSVNQYELDENKAKLPPSVSQFLQKQLKPSDYARTTFGTLADHFVDQRVGKDIQARGGQVSEATANLKTREGKLFDSANGAIGSKLAAELLSAQRNLLAITLKNVGSAERELIAREEVAKAVRGEVEIVVRGNQVLGTRERITEANSLVNANGTNGVRAPGAGGFFYRKDQILGGIGNFLGTESRASKYANGLLDKVPSGTGTAALLAMPIISNMLDSHAGSAEDAIKRGREGSFGNYRAAGGALTGAFTGATIGATIGSAVPVVGTAIGGAVGAVAGGLIALYSSLKEAEAEIRQVKINTALTEFADRLSTLSAGGTGGSAAGEALDRLKTIDKEVGQKNTNESFFRDWRKLFLGHSFDQEKFDKLQTTSFRENYGGRLPDLTKTLLAQAEQSGRRNTVGDPAVLSSQLLSGQGGLNREFVQIISRLRGISVDAVLKELQAGIKQGQRSEQIRVKSLEARTSEEGQIGNFGRFALAVDAASESISRLRERATLLLDAFDGVNNAIHVSSDSNKLNAIGRNDSAFLEPLRLIQGAIGGPAADNLARSGSGLDAVTRVLPSVLASVTATSPTESADFATQVQRGVAQGLGYTLETLPREMRDALNVAIRGINSTASGERGLHNLYDELQVDTTKFVERLLGPMSDALKDSAGRILKELEARANGFADGLNKAQKNLNTIDELRDRIAANRVSSFRVNTEFAADNSYQRGRVSDFIPVSQLESGFQSRQERLTGLVGQQANDPNSLSFLLTNLRQQVRQTEQTSRQAYQTGGPGPAFQAATAQLEILRNRTANVVQALNALAQSADRVSVLQERLAHIQSERESRQGLGERYLTADNDGRARILRSASLADRAVRQGHLNNFVPQDAQSIVEFLRSAGRTTLNFSNGTRQTGEDAVRQLIDGSAGGIFQLPPDMIEEQRQLQQEISGRFADAEAAMNALATDLETENTQFLANLNQQLTSFIASLKDTYLKREQIQSDTAEQGQVGVRLGELKSRERQGKLLETAGIDTTDKLLAAQNARPLLEQYATAFDNVQSQRRIASQVNTGFDAFFDAGVAPQINPNITFDQFNERIRPSLQSTFSGLTSPQIEAILTRFRETGGEQIRAETAANGGNLSNERRTAIVRQNLQASLRHEVFSEGDGTILGTNLDVMSNLRPRLNELNINRRGLDEVLAGGNRNQFFEGLQAFNATNRTLEGLQGQINTTQTQFNLLTKAIEDNRAALNGRPDGAPPVATPPAGVFVGPPKPLATGGVVPGSASNPNPSVFVPKGADTVPAMLSPNEFVVNAKSAQANLGLLHKINSAGGPVYLADGGTPDDYMRLYLRTNNVQARRDELPSPDVAPNGFQERRDRIPYLVPGGVQARRDLTPENRNQNPFAQYADPEEVGLNAFDIARNPVVSRQPRARTQTQTQPQIDPTEATLRLYARQNPFGQSAQALVANQIRQGITRQQQAADQRQAFDHNLANGDSFQGIDAWVNGEAGSERRIAEARRRIATRQRQDAALTQRFGSVANARTNFLDMAIGSRVTAMSNAFEQSSFSNRLQARSNIDFAGAQNAHRFNSTPNYYEQTFRNRNQTGQTLRFANGGVVPGVGGVDTVPAYLSPGEGVLTPNAVSRIGTHAINYLNRGGAVQYYNDGGSVNNAQSSHATPQQSGGEDFTASMNTFATAANRFSESATAMRDALNSFAGNATALADAIGKMPRTISGQFEHTHTINLNGAEVMAAIMPELRGYAVQAVKTEMGRVFKEQMPEAGVVV